MIELLFGSWMGILSMFVILFVLGMMVYFVWVFVKKSRE
jgi:heme/copper-type cytochrome/quinol oxidase subunit 2